MGCGASTPAPPATGDAAPEKKLEPQAATAKAEPPPPEPAKSAPPEQTKPPPADPPRAQPQPQPAAASSSAPTSTALPARIRTEELIKLCQSSHFDRTQVTPPRSAHATPPSRVVAPPPTAPSPQTTSRRMDGLIDAQPTRRRLTCAAWPRHRQVEKLYELFKVISASGDDDGASAWPVRASARPCPPRPRRPRPPLRPDRRDASAAQG